MIQRHPPVYGENQGPFSVDISHHHFCALPAGTRTRIVMLQSNFIDRPQLACFNLQNTVKNFVCLSNDF